MDCDLNIVVSMHQIMQLCLNLFTKLETFFKILTFLLYLIVELYFHTTPFKVLF